MFGNVWPFLKAKKKEMKITYSFVLLSPFLVSSFYPSLGPGNGDFFVNTGKDV